MSVFKRLPATLPSRTDEVVGEIENHDAVIQATLTEMRKKDRRAVAAVCSEKGSP